MTQILEIPSLPEIEPIYALKFVQFSRTSCEQTPRQTQRGERAGGREGEDRRGKSVNWRNSSRRVLPKSFVHSESLRRLVRNSPISMDRNASIPL